MNNTDIYTIDLPVSLVAKMEELAKANETDMQGFIIALLEKALLQDTHLPFIATRLFSDSENDN